MNQDTRPLTPEEYAILKRQLKILAVFILLFMIFIVSILSDIIIWEDSSWIKSISILGIIILAFITGLIICWEWTYVKKDANSGKAELIKGRISRKDNAIIKYIWVNGQQFKVKSGDWHLINIGDEVIIELAPTSQIIFKIKNQIHNR